jgi:type IV pilus assembly protein PilA
VADRINAHLANFTRYQQGNDHMRSLQRRIANGGQGDEAFTLMELAVVILILGVLIGIAIPSFMLVRRAANDRLAQSTLRKFLISAEAEAQAEGAYTTATATGLAPFEPGAFAVGPAVASTGPMIASIDGTATFWAAATQSKTGECFFIRDSIASGISFGRTRNATVSCNATSAATAAVNPTW